MNLKLKMLGAAALLAVGAAAQAAPIYLDLGSNYGGIGVKADGPTTTGVFEALTYKYNSRTTFTDNGDGVFGAGDTVLGTGGTLKANGAGSVLAPAGFITGIDPEAGTIGNPGGPSNNGFQTNWALYIGWNDLVGTVNAFGGVDYTSGTIHMYLTDAANNMLNVLDFVVSAGGNNAIGQSLDLGGTVVVKNAGVALGAGTVGDLFNFADGTSFADVVGDVLFSSNQNTSPFFVNGNSAPGQNSIPANFYSAPGGTGYIEGEHDGSVTFDSREVPEPASLALVGLGLVGLASIRRRKSV